MPLSTVGAGRNGSAPHTAAGLSSQLLCEQVVGWGLRRTSYEVNADTGLFEPEYVNIFGIPFTFLPHEGGDGPPPPPPSPKTKIESVPEKQDYEIAWPNIIRIDHVYRPRLHLDLGKVKPLEINSAEIATVAELGVCRTFVVRFLRPRVSSPHGYQICKRRSEHTHAAAAGPARVGAGG